MPHPVRATKTALLDLVVLHRQGPFLEFLEAIEKAGALRTLEALARIGVPPRWTRSQGPPVSCPILHRMHADKLWTASCSDRIPE